MAWRNLRSEISEMFAEYSLGEELQEHVFALQAKRLYHARQAAQERYRRWWQRLKQDSERLIRKQAYDRASYHRRMGDILARLERRAYLRRYKAEHPDVIRASREREAARNAEQRRTSYEATANQHCAHCGKPFTRKFVAGSKQKYCKRSCVVMAWQQRQRRAAQKATQP